MFGSMSHSPATYWRDSVNTDLRLHLVHKVLLAIVPGVNPSAMNEPRYQSQLIFAKDIENACYKSASSRSEYYHRIAQKIYELQAESEKRREENRHEKLFEDITSKLRHL